MTLSQRDVDRLARALIARDSTETYFKKVLLELDTSGANYSELARALGWSRQGTREMILRLKNRKEGETQ